MTGKNKKERKKKLAKNDDFKQHVMNKIMAAFGSDVVGIYDKKLYVWSNVDGEKTQVAISLTVPKTQVEVVGAQPSAAAPGMIDFEAEGEPILGVRTFTPAEITQEERDNIAALMKELGL